MEGVAAASAIIAIVELSAKIASICVQYSLAVKHAKPDIDRLGGEVNKVTDLLQAVERLLQRPESTQLSTSQTLQDALKNCFEQLTQLNAKLDLGKRQKIMSSFGVRALKWPFDSMGVQKIINDLERCKQTISLALQVDQTSLILGIHQKIDLTKLPSAKGAAFDSHLDEHDARCLPNTRVELRRQISEWAEDVQAKCIFWLNGMAGTGKSTISRTIAQSFADEGQLGASFFFKRGEGDRGNATKFFTTIAAQLAIKVPALAPLIGKAVDADPTISEKALKEQFEKLILQPLSRIQGASPLASGVVIVIDALDEFQGCDIDALGIFLTSRPELPIRLGFKNMKGDTYQYLIVHEISQTTIEHDICVFVEHELSKIRVDRSLAMGWPGQENIQALVTMAIPLFIFAATVCRFIGDPRWDPKRRLATILEYQTINQMSKFDKTYLPTLDQLLVGQDELEKEKLASEFQEVVGPIVILASPLSTVSLANLLGIPQDDIACRLDLLHSVLSIPTNQAHPVRLLHRSFRDFLVDPLTRKKTPFWIDERETHERLASKCLQLISKCLKQNICNLQSPGTLRSEIDRQAVEVYLPAEVQYACRYWVYHLEQSKNDINDNDEVHFFLEEHFLHWLEALSLLGNTSQSIAMAKSLLFNVDANKSSNIHAFVHDANRFVFYNRSAIEQAPLQIYCSALVFAPENSIVRRRFEKFIPPWIEKKPRVQSNWDPALQKLEGHTGGVNTVVFSPDGTQLATASSDRTVRLWDAATGIMQQTLEGHTDNVKSVIYSPNGQQLASASSDQTVRLWDAKIGSLQETLHGHSSSVRAVIYSPNGQKLASASYGHTVRFWDAETGSLQQLLQGHSGPVEALAFSPSGRCLASASQDRTVRLWDTEKGTLKWILEGHTDDILAVTFSPDGIRLASASQDWTVRVWDPETGAHRWTLEGHSNRVGTVKYSPNGQQLASASYDHTIRLWDAKTGALRYILEGHSHAVCALEYSPDGRRLASASWDKTVRLWDIDTGTSQQILKGHHEGVNAVAFSPDGKRLASASLDDMVILWDAEIKFLEQALPDHSGPVEALAFSPSGCCLASGSRDRTVRLWDPEKGTLEQILEGHTDWVTTVTFSPDGCRLASAPKASLIAPNDLNTIHIWDVETGALLHKLVGHTGVVEAITFSPDGLWLVSAAYSDIRVWDSEKGTLRKTIEAHISSVRAITFSSDGCRLASAFGDKVRIHNFRTGAIEHTLEGHSRWVDALAFSPNGLRLASASRDDTVRIWHTETGALHQTFKTGVSESTWFHHFGSVKAMTFSHDEQQLITNLGSMELSASNSGSNNAKWSSYSLPMADRRWIMWNGCRILWLPVEYRPTCQLFHSSFLAMGHSSGRVSIIKFNPKVSPIEGLT